MHLRELRRDGDHEDAAPGIERGPGLHAAWAAGRAVVSSRHFRSNLRAPGGRVPQQLLARIVVVHVLGEILQGSLLVTAQLARDLDLEAVVHVAAPLAVRTGWALAAQALH